MKNGDRPVGGAEPSCRRCHVDQAGADGRGSTARCCWCGSIPTPCGGSSIWPWTATARCKRWPRKRSTYCSSATRAEARSRPAAGKPASRIACTAFSGAGVVYGTLGNGRISHLGADRGSVRSGSARIWLVGIRWPRLAASLKYPVDWTCEREGGRYPPAMAGGLIVGKDERSEVARLHRGPVADLAAPARRAGRCPAATAGGSDGAVGGRTIRLRSLMTCAAWRSVTVTTRRTVGPARRSWRPGRSCQAWRSSPRRTRVPE